LCMLPLHFLPFQDADRQAYQRPSPTFLAPSLSAVGSSDCHPQASIRMTQTLEKETQNTKGL
jgi:hypothetical protein